MSVQLEELNIHFCHFNDLNEQDSEYCPACGKEIAADEELSKKCSRCGWDEWKSIVCLGTLA